MRAALAICVAVAAPLPAASEPALAKVVGVHDGDTVTVLDADSRQLRVRLAGIDAPERGQAFGQRSKEALSDCAFAKEVVLVGDKVDRYGRLVAKVLATGVDCNLRQVSLGLAWHYKQYEREQSGAERRAYAEAENAARDAGAGLWRERPQPPWEYRSSQRGGSR